MMKKLIKVDREATHKSNSIFDSKQKIKAVWNQFDLVQVMKHIKFKFYYAEIF